MLFSEHEGTDSTKIASARTIHWIGKGPHECYPVIFFSYYFLLFKFKNI